MFATRGQSREKECVNYYSLNGRLKEEAAHMMKACGYSLRDVAERRRTGGVFFFKGGNKTKYPI